MNDDPRFDQAARSWLELGPTQVRSRTVEAVLLQIETTPQRRGLRAPWRTPRMLTFATSLAAAAAILVLATSSLAPIEESGGIGPSLPPTDCPSPLASGSIATIAGTGARGVSGDGGPALDADLTAQWGIAVDDDGNVFFSDQIAKAVRRIGLDGIITTVAGPETGADFVQPQGLAFDPDGRLFVSDLGAARIWRVESDGSTTAVAGTGVSGTAGNEGPAIEAEIQPLGLAIGPAGDLYFDDLNNFRRVDADGVIHAFAGSTAPGYGGDGGPAIDAAFGESVMGVAADGAGNVYLGDPGNRRIRKVDRDGVVTTIAGAGAAGRAGDGAPATESLLTSSPFGLAVDDDGSLYVTEFQTTSIRKVDPIGILSTVVGKVGGEVEDCGPASEAGIGAPLGVAVHDGVLYLTEDGRGRIRIAVP